MGKVLRTLWGIFRFIPDIWDYLDIFGRIGVGSGVGALITFLQNLSPIYPITLTIVTVLAMTIYLIRWLKLKELRKECFEISVILEKMHNRMAEIAKEKAPKVNTNKCLKAIGEFVITNKDDCESVYLETVNIILDKTINTRPRIIRYLVDVKSKLNILLTNKEKMKRNKTLLNTMVAIFDKNNIGIRFELTKDVKYKSLEDELLKVSKYCTDDKIEESKKEYLSTSINLNTQIILLNCLARQKRFPLPENIKIAEVLFPERVNEEMKKEMKKIKKQILKHWKGI